jgi:hypothetical protein
MMADVDDHIQAMTAVRGHRVIDAPYSAGISDSMSGRSPPGRGPCPGSIAAA